jgi:hypothetical protein
LQVDPIAPFAAAMGHATAGYDYLIREVADEALKALSPRFSTLYAEVGRPSIPPEQLLRALCCKPSTPSARNGS